MTHPEGHWGCSLFLWWCNWGAQPLHAASSWAGTVPRHVRRLQGFLGLPHNPTLQPEPTVTGLHVNVNREALRSLALGLSISGPSHNLYCCN